MRQLKLRDAIVEVEDGHAGLAAETQCKGAYLQLGARARVCPNAVASNQRPIRYREYPFIFARGRKTDRTADVRQSRDAGGRIGGGQPADEQRGQADDCTAKDAQVDATNDHGSFSSYLF